MYARDALNGADARTFRQCSDCRDLLVGAEDVCHAYYCITETSACQVFLCYSNSMPYLIFAVLLTIMQAAPPVPRKAADKPANPSSSVKQAAANKEHSLKARAGTPGVPESNQDKG